ncbi:MAG: TlpA family protein disulfide reductase [Chloroflexi bacterium]|nr:TlpA family protein disulfide reductase [Chloroflexota bacterium]
MRRTVLLLLMFVAFTVVSAQDDSTIQTEPATRVVFPGSQTYSLTVPTDWYSNYRSFTSLSVTIDRVQLYVASSERSFLDWQNGVITGPVLHIVPSDLEEWYPEDLTLADLTDEALLMRGLDQIGVPFEPDRIEIGEIAGYPAATYRGIMYRGAADAGMSVIISDDSMFHVIYGAESAEGMETLETVLESFNADLAELPLIDTAQNPADVITTLTVGDAAPDFVGNLLDGRTVSLEEYAGRVTVITFWATWCIPCQYEMPLLEEAISLRPDIGVIGVNYREAPGLIRQFVEEFELSFPIALDNAGLISNLYSVQAYPTTYILDGNGVIQMIPAFTPTTTSDDVSAWLDQVQATME